MSDTDQAANDSNLSGDSFQSFSDSPRKSEDDHTPRGSASEGTPSPSKRKNKSGLQLKLFPESTDNIQYQEADIIPNFDNNDMAENANNPQALAPFQMNENVQQERSSTLVLVQAWPPT